MVFNGKSLEIMTYPMVGEKLLDQAFWPEKNEKLVLVNSMSPEHDRMRPSIIPSLLEYGFPQSENLEFLPDV